MSRHSKVYSVLILLITVYGCSTNKSDEIKAVKSYLNESLSGLEQFVISLEKAKSDKEIISAVTSYSRSLDALLVKSVKVKKTLDEMKPSNPSAEFKDEIEKFQITFPRFMNAYKNILKRFNKNPEVADAITEMMKKNGQLPALTFL